MFWTAPSFVEIKMDAEIGSYQPDEDRERPERPLAVLARVRGRVPVPAGVGHISPVAAGGNDV
jgi:hypothetical protein